jgi:hypothetical protein
MDDPDYPEHSLLEQYQAQVVAALRPAFAPDTPAAVVAQACRLCALYTTCGVGAEVADQTRTLRLLLSVFDRTAKGGAAGTRGAATATAAASTDLLATNGQFSQQETVVLELAALTAWAEMAIAQSGPQGARLGLPSLLAPYALRGRPMHPHPKANRLCVRRACVAIWRIWARGGWRP